MSKLNWQKTKIHKNKEHLLKDFKPPQLKTLSQNLQTLFDQAEKNQKGSRFYKVVLSMKRQALLTGAISSKQSSWLKDMAGVKK